MPVPASHARRQALRGLAAALLLPPLAACAHETRSRAAPLSMSIVDRDSGQVLTAYLHEGRRYVAGRPGARYAIRIANPTGGRVLVVLAVDGVNVVSGETAAVGQVGYVLDPGRSADIAGWRKSGSEIAAFEFAALSDSYAARTGRPGNVGVIGAAVFLEQVTAPVPSPPIVGQSSQAQDLARAPAARAAPAAAGVAAANATEALGTAHGQREWSVSTRTTFERASRAPQALIEIGYDSRERLVAAGIIAAPDVLARARPQAFPDDDGLGFVPDPPAR